MSDSGIAPDVERKSKAELKDKILWHLYSRVRRNGIEVSASTSTIRKAIDADYANNYIKVLINSLVDESYVKLDDRQRAVISEAGIDFVEGGGLQYRFVNKFKSLE